MFNPESDKRDDPEANAGVEEESESSSEKTNYLKNKLDGIVKAAKFRLDKASEMNDDEEYPYIKNEIDLVSQLGDLSGSITVDQAYEQLRFIFGSLESHKSGADKAAKEAMDFFQEQIMLYFSDLHDRKIPKVEK